MEPANWRTLLHERGISDPTIEAFHIQPNGNGWEYPVPSGGSSRRWKNYDSDASPKYRWSPGKPPNARYYHGPNLRRAIRQAFGVVWLACGEADVWALHAAGIENALSGFTETAVPPTLAADLKALGAKIVFIAPDRDRTGDRFARKVRDALKGSSLHLITHQLPDDLGPHADLGKAWAAIQDPDEFRQWLLELPEYEFPTSEGTSHSVPTSEPTPSFSTSKTTAPHDPNPLPKSLITAIEEALGVTTYYPNGFSHSVSCPFHDDDTPSAGWHHEKGFLHCFTCGADYTAIEVAAELSIDLPHRTIPTSSPTGVPLSSRPTAPLPTYPSLPTEAREALLQRGHTGLARALDMLYMAGIKPNHTFTMPGIKSAYQRAGLAYQTVYDALQTEIQTPQDIFISVFAPSSFITLYGGEKEDNNRGRGRPPRIYALPGPEQVCRWLGIDPGAVHFDPMPEDALGSVKSYRAHVYAALPRRRPGRYTRQALAERVGVTEQTARSYDALAGLQVTPSYKRERLCPAHKAAYTEHRGDRPGNEWIEDGRGKRYAPTKDGFRRALAATGRVYQVVQRANHYQGAELKYQDAFLRMMGAPEQLRLPVFDVETARAGPGSSFV